jgi:guanine deaminase
MAKTQCGCGCATLISRRSALSFLAVGALAGSAPRPAAAKARLCHARPEDAAFMRLALEEAARGDFPFGAVIVCAGKVVARGHNVGATTNDPTAHGEIVVIRSFLEERPAAELKGATIYTTGEPCPMCMSAILWCGFGRVVYAASIGELARRMGQIMVTSRKIADAASFTTIEITGGVLAAEALALFPPPH